MLFDDVLTYNTVLNVYVTLYVVYDIIMYRGTYIYTYVLINYILCFHIVLDL